MLNKVSSFVKTTKFVYFLLTLFVLLDRILIYQNFNCKFVGNDDLIFWQGANDYMHGHFYVPYYYGQNYNVMLEALFAVPFLVINIPYQLSLFLATSITTLFPFFIFSFVLWKRGYQIAALFFISIPLLLPVEYGLITSMTRGFVNGLFFSGFYVFAILSPHKKSSWLIAFFATAIGYFVNPSIVVVTVPVLAYLFFINFKQPHFYLYGIVIILPVFFLEANIKEWYSLHPETNLCPMLELKYDTTLLLKSFDDLDTHFSYLSPVIWSAGWIILPLGLILGILLLKKEAKKGMAILLGILFIAFSLGVNKVHQYINTILYSAVRMYLGIPIFTGIIFLWSRSLFSHITDKRLARILLCLVISCFFIKSSLYSLVVRSHTSKQIDFKSVAIRKLDDVKCECETVKKIATTNKVDLVVVISTWDTLSSLAMRQFVAHSCPLLDKNFPPTILHVYEKRFWLYEKEKKSVHKNILFYGGPNDIGYLKTIENCNILKDTPSQTIYVISNNTLRLDSLCKKLNVRLF